MIATCSGWEATAIMAREVSVAASKISTVESSRLGTTISLPSGVTRASQGRFPVRARPTIGPSCNRWPRAWPNLKRPHRRGFRPSKNQRERRKPNRNTRQDLTSGGVNGKSKPTLRRDSPNLIEFRVRAQAGGRRTRRDGRNFAHSYQVDHGNGAVSALPTKAYRRSPAAERKGRSPVQFRRWPRLDRESRRSSKR